MNLGRLLTVAYAADQEPVAPALLSGLTGAVGAIVAGLLLYFGLKQLRASQAKEHTAGAQEKRANARRTEAETWELMRKSSGDMYEEIEAFRHEVSELHAKQDALANQNRRAIAHIVAVHEWDASGRVGPMPHLPAGLVDLPDFTG